MSDIDDLRPTPSYPVRPIRENEDLKRRERRPAGKAPEIKRPDKPDDNAPQVDEYA